MTRQRYIPSTFAIFLVCVCSVAAQTPGTVVPKEVSATAAAAEAVSKAPDISRQQKELFLKTAKVLSKEFLESGTTKSLRATLRDGELTHEAHIQFVDIYKPSWQGQDGSVEEHFRDTYKFNIAAYRLDKMLGLNMVPVSVEREVEARIGAVTWWVDNLRMTEVERRDRGIKPPAAQFWVDQVNKVKVFDRLIHNIDRNQENLLITNDWKLWMIDHTRAFRTSKTLLKPEELSRCDYHLLAAMRKLNRTDLENELGAFLRTEEIAALLARRDELVRFFESAISKKGDDAVLTGIPRTTPVVAIP
ncbi:MAG: hypothetical protein ACRD7E_05220 [Bryobacteraceae bacterium]